VVESGFALDFFQWLQWPSDCALVQEANRCILSMTFDCGVLNRQLKLGSRCSTYIPVDPRQLKG
jgi:hypothetical protein